MVLCEGFKTGVLANMTPINGRQHRYQKDSYLKIQLWIASCVVLGNILIGYALGWSAPVTRMLQDPKTTPLANALTEREVSWAASLLSLGFIIGANVCGYLSNVIGRRSCLIIGGVLVFLGYVLVTAAPNLASIYVGRFVTGLGTASIFINNIVYISEIASKNIRGMLLAFTGVMYTVGCLLVYSVGPFVSYYAVGGILLALSAMFVAGCFTIPESPMFYIIKGARREAIDVLNKLGRSEDLQSLLRDKDTLLHLEYEAESEIKGGSNSKINSNNIVGILKDQTNNKKKCLELFKVKSNKKTLIITVVLFIIQQTGGSTAILFYATKIFDNAESSIKSDIATIILGLTQVLGTLFTAILIEKMGRRFLILLSTSGCSICQAGMAIHFYLEETRHPILSSIGWLPLALLIFNDLFYNAGLSIVPVTLIGEMFTPNVRSIGSSISFSIGLIFGFISGVTYGYLVVLLGSHVLFTIYAVINSFGLVFSVIYVPETKGKSLAEIVDLLAK